MINRPDTWTARTHLVLWYALLFAAALTAICFIVPNDPREYSVVHYWVVCVSVMLLVGFIGWLIYLLRFNVFKRYGHLPGAYGIKTFSLYFIAIGAMIACAFIPPVVESIRANKAYTNEEIVNDINTINLDLCRLEGDSVETRWDKDTCIVMNDPADTTGADEAGEDVVTGRRYNDYTSSDNNNNGPRYLYRKEVMRRLKYADSAIQLNDSMYVFYECPSYNFLDTYYSDQYSKVKELGSRYIFDKVLRHYHSPGNRAAVKKELDALVEKYRRSDYSYGYEYPDNYKFDRQEYLSHIRNKYDITAVSYSIRNISGRKYRWKEGAVRTSIRVFYYVVIILTLLVFVFRHSTVKTFFLSLLASVILAILTSLFFAFTRMSSDRTVFLVMLFYFWLFVILALTIRLDPIRRAWKGIALNLFVVSVPYIPLIAVSLYYAFLELEFYPYKYRQKFIHKDLHLLIAEIAGFVILLVLLDTVIIPLYRRWHALPEQ